MAEQDAAKIAAKVTEAQKQDPKVTTQGVTVEQDVKSGAGITGGRQIENVRDDEGNITGVKVTFYNRPDLAGPGTENVTVK